MKKASKLKWLGLLAGLGLAVSGNAMAHLKINSKGGLKVYDSPDGAYWFTVGGRLHLDQVFFTGKGDSRNAGTAFGNATFNSGANIRRAFVDFSGGVGNDVSYMISLNFRPTTSNFNDRNVFIEKAFLNYKGLGHDSNVAFGQFYIPFGLENWGSSNNLMFLEPSLMSGITNSLTERGFGVYGDVAVNDMFTVAGAAYQLDTNKMRGTTATPGTAERSDKWAGAARVTFSPVHTSENVYHFGVSAVHQASSARTQVGPMLMAKSFTFSGYPEALNRATPFTLNTGVAVSGVKAFNLGGLEAGGIWGPVTVQGEYQTIRVRRDAQIAPRGNLRFNGWHVQGGYVLTGESREYCFATGTFGSVKPTQANGAWELVARYSYSNLNNKEIFGNKAHGVTVGVNWFVNDNVRVAANYIRSITRQGMTGAIPAKRRLNIIGLRGQLVW